MAEIEIKGKKLIVNTRLAKRATPAGRIQIAGTGQKGSNITGNEGVYISSEYYRNDISGKPYPGRINFNTQRVLAYNSTVVRAILTLRAHQVAKLPYKIMPRDDKEPPRQISILEYSVYDLDDHPAFDAAEVAFLRKIYEKLDPKSYIADKKELFEEKKEDFTPANWLRLSTYRRSMMPSIENGPMILKKLKKFLTTRTRGLQTPALGDNS